MSDLINTSKSILEGKEVSEAKDRKDQDLKIALKQFNENSTEVESIIKAWQKEYTKADDERKQDIIYFIESVGEELDEVIMAANKY